jgi:small nuclear ribonucleoprotein D3
MGKCSHFHGLAVSLEHTGDSRAAVTLCIFVSRTAPPNMAVLGIRQVGIPTILMHEGEGLTITVETKRGWAYRGYCQETEDCMNLKMKNVTATDPKGRESRIDHLYIRGPEIVFVIFPEILSHAPMFQRIVRRQKGEVTATGLGRQREARMAEVGCAYTSSLKLFPMSMF